MLILKAYLLMATLGFDRSQQQGARAGWLQRQKVCSQISFCGKEQLWVQMWPQRQHSWFWAKLVARVLTRGFVQWSPRALALERGWGCLRGHQRAIDRCFLVWVSWSQYKLSVSAFFDFEPRSKKVYFHLGFGQGEHGADFLVSIAFEVSEQQNAFLQSRQIFDQQFDELLGFKVLVWAIGAAPSERVQMLLFDFVAFHVIEHQVIGTGKQPSFCFVCCDAFSVDPQFFKTVLYGVTCWFDISQEMQTKPIQRIAVEVYTGIVVRAVQNCVRQ